MNSPVTIEGRIATTYLRVGERVTVERTRLVESLIDKGYVRVTGAEAHPAGSLLGDGAPSVYGDSGHHYGTAEDAPPGNASKVTWRAFLEGLGIEVSDGATRADMIEVYRGYRPR